MIQELWHGDCLELIENIPDKSIDVILTSPPYIQVGKSYDENINYEQVIDSLSNKLKDNGIFIWQVGCYIKKGFVHFLDIETNPFFVKNNFSLINRVIWHYGHGLHCKNRFSGRYETICFYSKNKDHVFNLDSIRVPSKYPNKKHFKGPRKGELSGNPLGKNPSDIWAITNVKHNHPEKTGHPCQFPEELVSRCILAFSNENDIIFDPFLGSGTTCLVAKNLNRQFIGIEKEKEYYDICTERLK